MPLSYDADQTTGYRHNGSWWQEHQKFMASPQWAVLRYRALRRDGYKCQRCGVKAVQVHHLQYRSSIWLTRLSDLQSLCMSCHCTIHRHMQPFIGTKQDTKQSTPIKKILSDVLKTPAAPAGVDKYLNVAEVAQRFRISKRTIQMRVRIGTFPQPYRWGPNQVLWLIADLEKYEQAAAPHPLVTV